MRIIKKLIIKFIPFFVLYPCNAAEEGVNDGLRGPHVVVTNNGEDVPKKIRPR